MKNILFLLSLTTSPVLGFTSIFYKNQHLLKDKTASAHIQEWYDNFSLKELNEEELATIAKEIELLRESDVNRSNYEKFLADYHNKIVSIPRLHDECYLAVENACGHIVAANNSCFKSELQEYLQKTHDALQICKTRQRHKVS